MKILSKEQRILLTLALEDFDWKELIKNYNSQKKWGKLNVRSKKSYEYIDDIFNVIGWCGEDTHYVIGFPKLKTVLKCARNFFKYGVWVY